MKINNPPGGILVGQSYTLRATGEPPGGTYTWTVKRGADQVAPTTGTGQSFTITGAKKSPRANDVLIEVEYMKATAHCELTVVEIKLKSVTFGGRGFHAVAQDRDGSPYGTPHWLDDDLDGNGANETGDRRFPILYERGQKVVVRSLAAVVEPADFKREKVPIRGTATDDHAFSGEASIDKGQLVVSAAMAADRPVRDSVYFYHPYEIRWDAALTDKAFRPIGTSDNRIHVTLAAPAAGTILYETVCELSCEDATGATDKAQTVAMLWTEFTDLDVRRKPLDGFNRRDGVRMGYWRPVRPTLCRRLAQMLASPLGDGICSAWAELFDAMVRIHGFSEAETRIYFLTADADVNRNASGFLVKEWAFGEGGVVLTGDNGINDSTRAPDDVDFVKKGNGYPHTICISPKKPDAYPKSIPGGDDQPVGNEINTGRNGICETRAHPDDNQLIELKKGLKNMPCILAGANQKIDSKVVPDDGDWGTTPPPADADYRFVLNWTAFDQPGAPAQDNPGPVSYFNDHLIVKILGEWYDPSYGLGPFTKESDYEDAALAGITKVAVVQFNGQPTQAIRARTKTKGAKELKYTEFDRDFKPKG